MGTADQNVVADDDTSSAHTPGPWTVSGTEMDDARAWIFVDDGGRYIASVGLLDDEKPEDEANARLIAAAPVLLEQLKSVHADLKHARDLMVTGDPYSVILNIEESWDILLGRTEDVIRKAEGS